MNNQIRLRWQPLLSLLALCILTLFASGATLADEGNIVLDGLRDADYVLIATDPAGDLASPGPGDWEGMAWADMTELYVSADSDTLYVYVPSSYNQSVSAGQIGLFIDVDGNAGSGGTSDPWGNAITFEYNTIDGTASASNRLPDYVIRGNIVGIEGGNGYAELREWNGVNFDTGAGVNWGGIDGGQIGTHIAYGDDNGIELAIPLADIGNPDPADVRLQFIGTQGGGSKGAYDTIPSDDQSNGWDDATEQDVLTSVPLAVDPADDLASPGPGDWEGVAWTDMTRMHIWSDSENLHVYIPMPDYGFDVSRGQLVFAIDTTPGDGGSSDPWGNAITFAYDTAYQNLGTTPVAGGSYLPDIVIRGNIFGPEDNGWTEMRQWNGNWDTGGGIDWGGIGSSGAGSQPGSNIAWSDGDGLRLTIPFADIGVAAEDTIHLEFIGTQSGGGKGAYDTVPTDDQSDGWDDPTTQTVVASYTIPEVLDEAAPPDGEHDNNIFWDYLGHDSRSDKFRTPGGAVTPGTEVKLRLQALEGDLTEARVRVWDDRNNVSMMLPLTLVASDATYDYWETTLTPTEPTIYYYRFVAIDGTATAYYEDDGARDGGWGQTFGTSPDNSYQLTVYDAAFETPDWVKNGIMYQIFPDRFRNGDDANNPAPGRFFYGELDGTIFRSDPAGGSDNAWNTVVCDPREEGPCAGTYSLNFYGGDLQGVIDQLDYLDELGITILYFNPIFESPSNHKYDTTDYMEISADFGDIDTFVALVNAANERGMRIVLDGVFNHTSSDSVYFDRYSRFDADGNLVSPGPGDNDGSGACEATDSAYRTWYYFIDVDPGLGACTGDDGTPFGANYESWFGFDSLPKLRAGEQPVRDLIWDQGTDSVAPFWMQYADGWRLDVGGDVDPGLTNDPNNDYWEGFRAAVRAVNPEAYIVLEEWGNATAWTLGNEMDATMNYQYSSAILSFWRDTTFTDNDHNDGSSAGVLAPLTPSQLDGRLKNWQERYPAEAYYAMMNLLGSHDTNRPLFFLDHNAADQNDDTLLQDPNYDWSDAITRLKGVTMLQFTLPGSPTVYYGDEVGLVGPTYFHGGKWEDDPYNRQPYPWLDESGTPFYTHLQTTEGQAQLLDHYKLLTAARNGHPALQTGSFDTLLVDDEANVYAFGRLMADYSDAAVVVANRAVDAQDVVVDVAGYLPVGAMFEDVMGSGSYTVAADGTLTLPSVPGMYGAILVATGPLTPPPTVEATLFVSAELNAALELSLGVLPEGDATYNLYRSILSGGGYELIDTFGGEGWPYLDSGLANGVRYHYVYTVVDSATGLESAYSNEASGIPQHDLSTAWYALTWPPTIEHTISAINPTEPIYGQLYIDGATGENGPAAGITAQIGYIPTGAPPNPNNATWVTMPYIGPAAFAPNNDEFSNTLLPDMVGEYAYIVRFSPNGGLTWSYADLDGPGALPSGLTNPGILTVLPSDDTTAPDAPSTLTLDGTTASTIAMSWTASAADDVAGYEIYRSHVSAEGGFTKIATVAADVTSYLDEAVETGETYQYYVVAFDTSFNRSDASNTIEATAEARLVNVTWLIGVPAYTPSPVYIVGDQPEWGPWNPGLAIMTQVDDTTWSYTGTILDGTDLQFKFTRGSWDTVESWGSITTINNRSMRVEYGTDGNMLVDLTATDWGNGADDTKAVRFWRDPIVVDYAPADGATDVPTSTPVVVEWPVPMEPDTDFVVEGPGGPVAGTFAYDESAWPDGNTVVTFTPAAPLAGNTEYTVTVAGAQSVGVPNGDAGAQQSPVTWTFTTAGGGGGFFPAQYEMEACWFYAGSGYDCAMHVLTLNRDGTYAISDGETGIWRFNRSAKTFALLDNDNDCYTAWIGVTPDRGLTIVDGEMYCLEGSVGSGSDRGYFSATYIGDLQPQLVLGPVVNRAIPNMLLEICWLSNEVGCGYFTTMTINPNGTAFTDDGSTGVWVYNNQAKSGAFLTSEDCEQIYFGRMVDGSFVGRAECMDGSGGSGAIQGTFLFGQLPQ